MSRMLLINCRFLNADISAPPLGPRLCFAPMPGQFPFAACIVFLRSRCVAVMSEHRVIATRLRRAGQPCRSPRRPGPACSGDTNSKAGAQRRRRVAARARSNVEAIICGLLDKDVIPITDASGASDVARLRWLASCLRDLGIADPETAPVLILDWAARNPQLTADFLAQVQSWPATNHTRAEFLKQYRTLWAEKKWSTFWKGPTGLNLSKFIAEVRDDELVAVADQLVKCRRVRAGEMVSTLAGMKFLSSYCAFAAVRSVACALGIKVRDTEDHAAGMSLNTSLLCRLLPLTDARAFLRRYVGSQVDNGYVAFVYCETVKILRHEGILEPLGNYSDAPDAFAEALASLRAGRLVQKLADMDPVVWDGNAECRELRRVAADVEDHTSTDILARWRKVSAAETAKKVQCKPATSHSEAPPAKRRKRRKA